MKVFVIGAGTAGLLTCMELCHSLPDFFDITLVHDPDIESIGVGESSLVGLSYLLFDSIDYVHFLERGDLNATTKYGVKFKSWSSGDDIFVPFGTGNYGLQFDTTNLKDFVLPRLLKKYKNFNILEAKVNSIDSIGRQVCVQLENKILMSDYVVDCRGFPEDYSDYIICDNVYVNSALVVPSTSHNTWEYTYHYAHKNGWMFGIPLNNRSGWGYLYNSELTTRDECLEDIENIFSNSIDGMKFKLNFDKARDFSFKSYYIKDFMNEDRNIFYNGNKALFLEPIQATSIGCYNLINVFIAKYINHTMEYEEIFESYRKMMEECLLFVNLHYANGSIYDSDFWKLAKQKSNEILREYDINNYSWEFAIDSVQLLNSVLSNFNPCIKH